MQDTKIFCNKCGEQISYQDRSDDNYHFYYDFGYASSKDGQNISFDLCGKCLDSMLNALVRTFKYVPEGWNIQDDVILGLEDHQKVFEHWKEANIWDELMFYTYEQLKCLNGYFNVDYLNYTIKKYHPDMPLLEEE